MVAPAVWLTGALGVCFPILHLMRVIHIFKTCLTLSAYLFVFVTPLVPVCFAYNKF